MKRATQALLSRPLWFFLPLQAALLLPWLDLLPVWGDEQFTLNMIRLSWDAIPAALARDIHPPLYFFAVKAWATWTDSPLLAARAFSVAGVLTATIVLDRLLIRKLEPENRLWFLALWCLSPALLLYGRMARSYSWQIVAAAVAFWAAQRVLELPNRKRAAGFGLAAAVTLYVHYLPGLAVLAGGVTTLLVAAWRDKQRQAAVAALVSTAVCVAAYLPWLGVLSEGIGQAAAKQVHWVASSFLAEAAVRLGYWFISFGFGEALSVPALGAAVAMSFPLVWLLLRGVAQRPFPLMLVTVASVVALIGTWRWTAFAFTPARSLFLLPFFAATIAAGITIEGRRGRLAGLALLATSLLGASCYYRQAGFLNKGYLIPFPEIARVVSEPPRAKIAIDFRATDSSPLAAQLRERREDLLLIRRPAGVSKMRRELSKSTPGHVWVLGRRGRLGGLSRSLYEEVHSEGWMPYSPWERGLSEILSGRPPPNHRYEGTLYRRRKRSRDR